MVASSPGFHEATKMAFCFPAKVSEKLKTEIVDTVLWFSHLKSCSSATGNLHNCTPLQFWALLHCIAGIQNDRFCTVIVYVMRKVLLMAQICCSGFAEVYMYMYVLVCAIDHLRFKIRNAPLPRELVRACTRAY